MSTTGMQGNGHHTPFTGVDPDEEREFRTWKAQKDAEAAVAADQAKANKAESDRKDRDRRIANAVIDEAEERMERTNQRAFGALVAMGFMALGGAIFAAVIKEDKKEIDARKARRNQK